MATRTDTTTVPRFQLKNPKDSMVSTWRNDPSKWTWKHHFLSRLDHWTDSTDPIFPPTPPPTPKTTPTTTISYPVMQKTDPVPWFSQWSMNRWILTHAAWPMAVQVLLKAVLGRNLSALEAFGLYTLALQLNLLLEVGGLQRVAMKVGFLDGDKHPRDRVPDVGVDKTLFSIALFTIVRPTLGVLLAYQPTAPIRLSGWLPVELFLYPLVLDFFFYVYHRATHELDGLWRYHRTHHLTKHPNPLLSSYADREQEIIEIAVIPALTYVTLKVGCGLPMGFYDWWVCMAYNAFIEAFGHTGLRAMVAAPGVALPFLRAVGCELVLEDHDLHHRRGWRKCGNYGKQTRFWDRVFGTCLPRIESEWENVDYGNVVGMPWL